MYEGVKIMISCVEKDVAGKQDSVGEGLKL